MNFNELQYFIEKKMRMQRIYQPAMLIALLENKGKATITDISNKIYSYDSSETSQYYAGVIDKMPGDVLKKRDIVTKDSNFYSLNGFNNLSEQEIEILKQICEEKIERFKNKKSQQPVNIEKNLPVEPPIGPGYLKDLIEQIHLLKNDPEHKERAHESLVESFYEKLGFEKFIDIKHRQGRIDISIVNDSGTLIVNEVKKDWSLTYRKNEVLKQAYHYALEVGAKHVVITNGDYYAFFDREKGLSIESNLEKEFRLTKLRTEDVQFIETLKKENFIF